MTSHASAFALAPRSQGVPKIMENGCPTWCQGGPTIGLTAADQRPRQCASKMGQRVLNLCSKQCPSIAQTMPKHCPKQPLNSPKNSPLDSPMTAHVCPNVAAKTATKWPTRQPRQPAMAACGSTWQPAVAAVATGSSGSSGTCVFAERSGRILPHNLGSKPL